MSLSSKKNKKNLDTANTNDYGDFKLKILI